MTYLERSVVAVSLCQYGQYAAGPLFGFLWGGYIRLVRRDSLNDYVWDLSSYIWKDVPGGPATMDWYTGSIGVLGLAAEIVVASGQQDNVRFCGTMATIIIPAGEILGDAHSG